MCAAASGVRREVHRGLCEGVVNRAVLWWRHMDGSPPRILLHLNPKVVGFTKLDMLQELFD